MIGILTDSFRSEWERLLNLAPRLMLALLAILIFLLAARILSRGLGVLLDRSGLAQIHRDFFRRLSFWVIMLGGVTTALSIIGLTNLAAGLLASGGLTAVVFGFAFREIGENFLAGFFLSFSRPFNLGDWIQSGEFEGSVRGIQLRTTHIRTGDGKDIFIPNAQIFNTALINYTLDGLRRPSFRVGVDYADDSERACAMLTETVRKIPGVLEDPPVLVRIVSLLPSYVELEVAFWIDTFNKSFQLATVRDGVINECRKVLRDSGFTLSTDVTSSLVISGGAHPVEVQVSQDTAE